VICYIQILVNFIVRVLYSSYLPSTVG